MRIGIFVDVSNIYYCISKKFPSRKLDYEKYVAAIGQDVSYACAYGTFLSEKVIAFVTALKHIGFQTFFRRGRVINDKMSKVQWGVGLAVNAMSKLDELDSFIIGSADPELVPLVDYLKSKGKEVHIFGCGINKALKERATSWREIEEDVLEAVE
jgi:uncharacterized LabA/DUF88 family protein